MAGQFRHILVPVDFTEKNRAAIDVAITLAHTAQATVTLLHIIEQLFTDDDEIDEFYERLETRAMSELDALAQQVIDAGFAVQRKVRYGKRGPGIVDFATEDPQCDLIVMNARPVDQEHPESGLGAISFQVSLLCHCPVLLVK